MSTSSYATRRHSSVFLNETGLTFLERQQVLAQVLKSCPWESHGLTVPHKSLSTALEANTFDDLNCMVLHLVSLSTDTASSEYARMILMHPTILAPNAYI